MHTMLCNRYKCIKNELKEQGNGVVSYKYISKIVFSIVESDMLYLSCYYIIICYSVMYYVVMLKY